MRLLFFISSLSAGGAERVTANLANYWAERGWDITIVTLAPATEDFYRLDPAVRRVAFGMTAESGNAIVALWRNLRRVAALRRVLKNAKPDIALGMMNAANVVLALASWGLPHVRAIGAERIHPPRVPLSALWERLRRHTYGRLAAVTALTCESANWLSAHTKARRIVVIPNAASWPLSTQGLEVNPAFVYPGGRRLVLAVGRLDMQKGFDWLIQAFAEVAPKYNDWGMAILGEGPERFALDAQVKSAGLKSRIFLPGHARNIGEWYERADLYVMSSRFEGFPNALVEALAHAVPAVSFDCETGPRDIIRHEVDGLLVPPGNVAALSAALGRLMGDPKLRRRFSERAVEARQRFSMERIVGRWEELFEEIRR